MALRDSSSQRWDEADFRTVFLRHYARIVAVLMRILGDRSHAEELANDAMWRLYRQPDLAVADNVGGWLYRTATNLGIDALRAANRRQQHEEAAGRLAQETGRPGPLDDLLREETRQRVRAALATVKPMYAQILILRAAGFSYKELADVLEVKATGIGAMLNRASEEFRERYLTLYRHEGGL